MSVIELPKRKPLQVAPEVMRATPSEGIPPPLEFFEHLREDATTSELLKHNIQTNHFLSMILTQILNTATVDLQSKRLLTTAAGVAQVMHEMNRLSFTSPETPNDEPERA